MPYKEIMGFSVGGIGVRLIVHCISQMVLSIGNVLIGNTIGIPPSTLYIIYIISVFSGIPLTALRASIIDNTRSLKGKYRPYLISMGIPTVLLGIGFVLMPYEGMSLFWKCFTVLGFNIGFQFFFNFYSDSYNSLINVLSPNSIERSDVLSVKYIIENLSPSIVNIVLPLVAKMITGENTLYDLKIYRVLFPPMLIVAFIISLLAYVNTEEKIVQAKTHIIQIKFVDAFKSVAKNKYFWIISLAGWLGFLESSFSSILGWMYNYQKAATPGQYSVITAITGNASFWPNLAGPPLIRKFGKKKILICTNILNICFILLMLPVVRSAGTPNIVWLLVGCIFINTFFTALGDLLNPSIQADIRDYQQYITGERIDGMFAAVGLIGNVITLATSSVLPTIYERAGLNSEVAASLGVSNVYDVLYVTDYFVKIASVLIMASAVGAVMNLIPFFFYNLTENDQRAMVSVLKIRALFEDFANNVLKQENLIEAVEIIENAKKYNGKKPNKLSKEGIKNARKSLDKNKIKLAKEEYKRMREENILIATSDRILDELNKFSSEQGIEALKRARYIENAGLNGCLNIELPSKKEIKAMPKTTEAEKESRRNLLMLRENIRSAKKAVKKYYPNGIEDFDNSVFEKLFAAQDKNENDISDTVKSLKRMNEDGNKDMASAQKLRLKELHSVKKEIEKEIKKATDQNSIYYRAAKPYLDAVKLIKQFENYGNYEKIFALYSETV
ncbi:MAG: MFS transporter [Oscillospiraceae bacterium]|nr:MFS transporter [Oscillospiraceae bacterium]